MAIISILCMICILLLWHFISINYSKYPKLYNSVFFLERSVWLSLMISNTELVKCSSHKLSQNFLRSLTLRLTSIYAGFATSLIHFREIFPSNSSLEMGFHFFSKAFPHSCFGSLCRKVISEYSNNVMDRKNADITYLNVITHELRKMSKDEQSFWKIPHPDYPVLSSQPSLARRLD